jgi:hypothetical protein
MGVKVVAKTVSGENGVYDRQAESKEMSGRRANQCVYRKGSNEVLVAVSKTGHTWASILSAGVAPGNSEFFRRWMGRTGGCGMRVASCRMQTSDRHKAAVQSLEVSRTPYRFGGLALRLAYIL